MVYTRFLQVSLLMSRAVKCQLRKIHLEGSDIESEWEDNTRAAIFTTSHVLDYVMFTQIRLVTIQEDPYLDLMRSFSTIITNA